MFGTPALGKESAVVAPACTLMVTVCGNEPGCTSVSTWVPGISVKGFGAIASSCSPTLTTVPAGRVAVVMVPTCGWPPGWKGDVCAVATDAAQETNTMQTASRIHAGRVNGNRFIASSLFCACAFLDREPKESPLRCGKYEAD